MLWTVTGIGPATVSYLPLPLAAAGAAAAVLDLLRRAPLTPPAVRFWRLMLVAFGLVGAGYTVLAVAGFRDTSILPPMPLPAAALAGAGFLTAMWAMVRVPLGIASAGERWRQWLDRAIAFLGCGTVLFHFGLAPVMTAATASPPHPPAPRWIELDPPGSPEADARQAVARAVVQLSLALGLDTVAEGIENAAQADRLIELGYSLGQGYHLARPMPAAEMTQLLSTQRDLVSPS
ncbi:EAL domain-containing protein [Dactylosporangium sp. NPDC006015]|uniref:EAL domain-containing protein n=1 Tax=Dactylosporangium sp. NPDC006015 TaxID=3154576 RepID=UPI0033AA2797